MPRRIPTSHRNAFTLVEILIVVIIMGILAAIVIPQFSNASQTSRTDALKEQLHTVREAIAAYRMQHMDNWPNLSSGWTPLMTQTNAQGGTSGGPLFGPYLLVPPVNAVSGGSQITTTAAAGYDYVWAGSTGTLTALDGQGNLFDENQ
jgi:general secretion pathway protein G